ncbi:MAG TPA: hypothetical protein VNW68_03665, partial [Candidatus Limnocylindria bacterium]|nr:hypothetical protein [Candidatus Limnocylindria bacterium]
AGAAHPQAEGLAAWAAAAASLRGDERTAAELANRLEEALARSSSAQDASGLHYMKAVIAFGRGRLEDARRLGLKSRQLFAGEDGTLAFVLAAHCAVLLGDRDALRRDAQPWDDRWGAWMERSGRTIAAASLALEGRTEEAVAAYRKVLDEWRAADLPFDLALALLERARLLGAADAEAAAGRDEAQAIFVAIGADGLLERIESGAGDTDLPIRSDGRGGTAVA